MAKASKYNHFQPWQNGYYIAYNARTGAVAMMTSENYAMYQTILEKIQPDSNGNLTDDEQQLLQQLQYGQFIIPDHFDEFQAIKFNHNLDRYDRTRLGLVIAPTLACNMTCEYCYEGNKKGRMSSEIIESIIEFVEKRGPVLQQADIGWYGGEPLLAMDIIDDITQSMLDLSKEHNFTYTSSMISNGYLLTKENVDRLVDLKVSVVQVTLDGPARMHNQKRPLKNGRESFATILDNLVYTASKMIVTVRVNIDKSYTDRDIIELLDELSRAGLQNKVSLYFGQLEPATDVCLNISESCFETADFSEMEVKYHKLLIEHGFRVEKLPSPVSTFCMAQNMNAHLIDPDGNLYRCFNQVGDVSKSYGNIRMKIDYQHQNFTNLFAFDPFEDEHCAGCDLLPVCMGGCPSRRIEQNLPHDDVCFSWRHNLQPMLEIIARSRQQQATAKEQS